MEMKAFFICKDYHFGHTTQKDLPLAIIIKVNFVAKNFVEPIVNQFEKILLLCTLLFASVVN